MAREETRDLQRPGIKVTGYVMWEGLDEPVGDLVTVETHTPRFLTRPGPTDEASRCPRR